MVSEPHANGPPDRRFITHDKIHGRLFISGTNPLDELGERIDLRPLQPVANDPGNPPPLNWSLIDSPVRKDFAGRFAMARL